MWVYHFVFTVVMASFCGNVGAACVTPFTNKPAMNLVPFTECAGVVDYSFYNWTNLDNLNNLAKSKLSDPRISVLPVNCLLALKKITCANIYLKCPNPGNADSFDGIYNLPFQRPCKSVCTATNTNCFNVLGLFDLNQNCTAKYCKVE